MKTSVIRVFALILLISALTINVVYATTTMPLFGAGQSATIHPSETIILHNINFGQNKEKVKKTLRQNKGKTLTVVFVTDIDGKGTKSYALHSILRSYNEELNELIIDAQDTGASGDWPAFSEAQKKITTGAYKVYINIPQQSMLGQGMTPW